eukprot:s4041_g1.t1
MMTSPSVGPPSTLLSESTKCDGAAYLRTASVAMRCADLSSVDMRRAGMSNGWTATTSSGYGSFQQCCAGLCQNHGKAVKPDKKQRATIQSMPASAVLELVLQQIALRAAMDDLVFESFKVQQLIHEELSKSAQSVDLSPSAQRNLQKLLARMSWCRMMQFLKTNPRCDHSFLNHVQRQLAGLRKGDSGGPFRPDLREVGVRCLMHSRWHLYQERAPSVHRKTLLRRRCLTITAVDDRIFAFERRLTSALKKNDPWQRILVLWDELRATGLVPSGHCCSAALSALSRAARWQEALCLFESRLREHPGHIPSRRPGGFCVL